MGEGGKWTVLGHCLGMWRGGSLSFNGLSEWEGEERLRMGRGDVAEMGDIKRMFVNRGKWT